MKRVTVFYNGKVWYETDGPADFAKYPVGAFVRRATTLKKDGAYWDRISERHYEGEAATDSVTFDSLPNWVKTWVLIL